jgi:hypothetical protein
VISLVETIDLPAPPERVWRFFEEIDRHYPDWHREHLTWRWLRGEPLTQGATWFADEWIGPLRVSGRFVVDRADRGRLFSYRTCFPSSLVGAGGSFLLTAKSDGGCRLIQDVHLGFSLPLIGRLLDRLLALALPLDELRRHMSEEQESLIVMLDQTSSDELQR